MKSELLAGIQHVNSAKNHILQFTQNALEEMNKPEFTPQAWENLGNHWETMGENVGKEFMEVSGKLIGLLTAIYSGHSDGFVEQDVCDNYQGFNAQYDPNNKQAYVHAMRDHFIQDSQCFMDKFSDVENVEAEIQSFDASDAVVTEREAARVILDMLHDLHIIGLNGMRFGQAVEQAASKVSFDSDPSQTEQLRTLLRVLSRSLSAKSIRK
jgi:hypothetical protein